MSEVTLSELLGELTRGVGEYPGFSIHLPLSPVAASRPRVGRWGTFYGKTYKKWKALAEDLIEDADWEYEGPVFVIVNCIVPPPKTTKLSMPKPDVDNYAKSNLDVVSKADGYWDDDSQVQTVVVHKRWAEPEEDIGSYIHIFPYE